MSCYKDMCLTLATLRMTNILSKLLIFGPQLNLFDKMATFEMKIQDLSSATHNSKHALLIVEKSCLKMIDWFPEKTTEVVKFLLDRKTINCSREVSIRFLLCIIKVHGSVLFVQRGFTVANKHTKALKCSAVF